MPSPLKEVAVIGSHAIGSSNLTRASGEAPCVEPVHASGIWSMSSRQIDCTTAGLTFGFFFFA